LISLKIRFFLWRILLEEWNRKNQIYRKNLVSNRVSLIIPKMILQGRIRKESSKKSLLKKSSKEHLRKTLNLFLYKLWIKSQESNLTKMIWLNKMTFRLRLSYSYRKLNYSSFNRKTKGFILKSFKPSLNKKKVW
jgi:hypothetical protein